MSNGARSKKSIRIKIIIPRDRLTASIKIGDESLAPVSSKEDLICQWYELRLQGRISTGQANWLLPAILTSGLRAMTRRGAADNRLFEKVKRRERRRHVPLDTLGGSANRRATGERVVAV